MKDLILYQYATFLITWQTAEKILRENNCTIEADIIRHTNTNL